jgi:hypothetical protein
MLKLFTAALLAVLPAVGHASTITYEIHSVGQIEIDRDALRPNWFTMWESPGSEHAEDNWHQIDIRVPIIQETQGFTMFDITVNEWLYPIEWHLFTRFQDDYGVHTYMWNHTTHQMTPIPIPPALALLAGGLGALAWVGRRRRAAIGASPAR